jgi:hypothetical protein
MAWWLRIIIRMAATVATTMTATISITGLLDFICGESKRGPSPSLYIPPPLA